MALTVLQPREVPEVAARTRADDAREFPFARPPSTFRLFGALLGPLDKLIVPSAPERHETKAVSKRISHHCDSTPCMFANGLLELRTSFFGTPDGTLEIAHDEVQMDRRPMSTVVTYRGRLWRSRGSCPFGEQVDRSRRSQNFDSLPSEASSDVKPERRHIEADGLFQVVDVDVDEQLCHFGPPSWSKAILVPSGNGW